MPAPAAARRRATQIAAQIAALSFVLPGTVASRYTRCAKPGCRCTASPPALHGPYLTWTRKASGKTVTRRLTEDQYQAYRPWFDASHTLRALLAELEALSLDIIEDELRSDHGKTRTSQPRKTPATQAGSASDRRVSWFRPHGADGGFILRP